ncbi:unnamed protein product, partial [Amoebophrya sp. A120]
SVGALCARLLLGLTGRSPVFDVCSSKKRKTMTASGPFGPARRPSGARAAARLVPVLLLAVFIPKPARSTTAWNSTLQDLTDTDILHQNLIASLEKAREWAQLVYRNQDELQRRIRARIVAGDDAGSCGLANQTGSPATAGPSTSPTQEPVRVLGVVDAPFTMLNEQTGEFYGFVPDLLTLISEALGVQFRFANLRKRNDTWYDGARTVPDPEALTISKDYSYANVITRVLAGEADWTWA